jgi:hypothetical protein
MYAHAIISGRVHAIHPNPPPSVCLFTLDVETYHPEGSRHDFIEVMAGGAIAERLSYLKPALHVEVDGSWSPSAGRVRASSVKPIFPPKERRD